MPIGRGETSLRNETKSMKVLSTTTKKNHKKKKKKEEGFGPKKKIASSAGFLREMLPLILPNMEGIFYKVWTFFISFVMGGTNIRIIRVLFP